MTSKRIRFLPLIIAILASSLAGHQAPVFDLWMDLDAQVQEAKSVGNTTECTKAIKNIINHLKNATFQQEVLAVVDNTGKMFNDIGYYQSCIQFGNLSYYLIRPRRTDLKVKFNFGVCVPDVCTVDDVSTLIAENFINKRFLAHIANGTENSPQDYNSTATIVPDSTSTNSYLEFKILVMVLGALAVLLPVGDYLINRKKKPTQEDKKEEERNIPTRVIVHVLDSFNLVSNYRFLMKGIKNQANTLNFIKVVCGMLIIYSGEYIRRHFLGIHQDDKEGLERFKDSPGFNLVYFSVMAFDILFFVGGATNTLALMTVLKEKRQLQAVSPRKIMRFSMLLA